LRVLGSQEILGCLSPTYGLKINSYVAGGQQSNIIFKRNY